MAAACGPELPMKPELVLTETRWGKYFVLRNDFLAQLFVRGEHFEDHVLSQSLTLLEDMKDYNVIDIGASFGSHAIPCASRIRATVHAFEPQNIVYDLLLRNIEKNGCRNVVPHRIALGHEDGLETTLSDKYELHRKLQSLSEPHPVHNYGGIGLGKGRERVTMKTLDSYGFTNVGLIKIDVEGAERLVLHGAVQTIERQRPYIVFEQHAVHHTEIFEQRWEELCDLYSLSATMQNTSVFDLLGRKHGYREVQQLDEINYLAIP